MPAESRGAAMQYFTGSKAHNIALRDRAISAAQAERIRPLPRRRRPPHRRATEEGIYEALGLAWIAPELRENRGEIEAAAAARSPRSSRWPNLRGDLHMHTTETDGRDDLEAMAAAAQRLGPSTSPSPITARRWRWPTASTSARARARRPRPRAERPLRGLTLLAGIECDILADGTLDLADDCLAQLDIVVASVHSHFSQDGSR